MRQKKVGDLHQPEQFEGLPAHISGGVNMFTVPLPSIHHTGNIGGDLFERTLISVLGVALCDILNTSTTPMPVRVPYIGAPLSAI